MRCYVRNPSTPTALAPWSTIEFRFGSGWGRGAPDVCQCVCVCHAKVVTCRRRHVSTYGGSLPRRNCNCLLLSPWWRASLVFFVGFCVETTRGIPVRNVEAPHHGRSRKLYHRTHHISDSDTKTPDDGHVRRARTNDSVRTKDSLIRVPGWMERYAIDLSSCAFQTRRLSFHARRLPAILRRVECRY